jgi:hypothetical protein
MKQLLRILSNNTVLTLKEEKEAETETHDLKAIQCKRIGGSNDQKRVDFIKRLFAITNSPATRHTALQIKLADSINNISIAETHGKPIRDQLDALRAVVSRFIVFVVEDGMDTENMFNLLPNLIETALSSYTKIHEENYDELSAEDFDLIDYLTVLAAKFPRKPLPANTQTTLDTYRLKRNPL